VQIVETGVGLGDGWGRLEVCGRNIDCCLWWLEGRGFESLKLDPLELKAY
jgi:hypothetical protein